METIGARAFSGASCLVVSLPNSLRSLAPDAFGDVVFDVLPGSWAAQWCRENDREFNTVKLNLNAETVDAATGRMPADANGDGKLTQHELFLYIKAREEDPAYFIYQNVQEYPLNSDYVLFVS